MTAALLALAGLLAAPRLITLEDALKTAAERQPQLRVLRAQRRAQDARVEQARAGYFPRVDGSAQYQRSTANFTLSPSFANSPIGRQIQIDNQLSPADTVNFYLFGATATVPIYDFGRTAGQVAAARASRDAAGLELETADETSDLQVRVAYFGVLAQKELVEVGERAVQNQGNHVKQVREFVTAGARPKIDLTSAELNLANARLALVRARNALDLAKVQLNQVTGAEGSIDYDVTVPMQAAPAEEGAPIDRLVDEALGRRPEAARVEAQLRAQEAQVKAARAGYLPQLFGTANLSGTKVEDFDAGINWYVGLGLSWNFFGGFQTTNQVAEAEATREALAAQRDALRQGIRAELEQHSLALGEARQRFEVAGQAVEAAAERLRLAVGRYRAGAGTILELDDAQITHANAEAQRVSAAYDIQIARARLARAIGKRRTP